MLSQTRTYHQKRIQRPKYRSRKHNKSRPEVRYHTAFYNTTAVIEEEIRVMSGENGFVWKTRPNGNLGLSWFVNQTETEG